MPYYGFGLPEIHIYNPKTSGDGFLLAYKIVLDPGSNPFLGSYPIKLFGKFDIDENGLSGKCLYLEILQYLIH